MISLPPAFETFKVNYNGSDQKWDITTLVSKCAQEGERLRAQNPISSTTLDKVVEETTTTGLSL